MSDQSAADVVAHYDGGAELSRLDQPVGTVELVRTTEILARSLPPPPATVADVGGGPGRYTTWLTGAGYEVHHRDLVPLHVEQLRSAAGGRVETAVGDARDLDLGTASVDAVLLLGPLYHLYERADRLAALREAGRVARPGAPVFAGAISRWAPRLHALLVERLYREDPPMVDRVASVETTGRMPPTRPVSFCGYCHRPEQLREEIEAAGLVVDDLVNVEGLAFALPDLAERLTDPADRAALLDCLRATERVPELLGLGPHLLATARAR